MNMAPLHAIVHFSLATLIPLDTTMSFTDLATLVPLHEHDIRRIVRYAIAHHRVFCEPKPGFVAHSAASRVLAESSGMRDALGMLFDESWPAFAKVRGTFFINFVCWNWSSHLRVSQDDGTCHMPKKRSDSFVDS